MGYIAHDAVLVTVNGYILDGYVQDGPEMPDVDAFRDSLPAEFRPLLIGPVQSAINHYVHYVFLPDGSKEGWPESSAGDEYRDSLFSFCYEDGSSPFDVVRVRYGGDERYEPVITGPARTEED